MAEKYDQYPPHPQGPPPPYNQNPPVGFQSQTLYGQPSGSTTVVTTQPMIATQPVLIVAGANCPACRSGLLQSEFTCCGIFLAICCFPFGIICCLLMKERRCSNCRASYGSA